MSNQSTTTKEALEPCPWCPAKPQPHPDVLSAKDYMVLYHAPECFRSPQLGGYELIPVIKLGKWNSRVSAPIVAPVVDDDQSTPETVFMVSEPSSIDCAVCGGSFLLPETVIVKNAAGRPERACLDCAKGKPPVLTDVFQWPEQLTIIHYDDGGFSATQAVPPDKAKFAHVYYRDAAPAATVAPQQSDANADKIWKACKEIVHRINMGEHNHPDLAPETALTWWLATIVAKHFETAPASPAAPVLHCSCGVACTPEEYEAHRAMGHDAPAALRDEAEHVNAERQAAAIVAIWRAVKDHDDKLLVRYIKQALLEWGSSAATTPPSIPS